MATVIISKGRCPECEKEGLDQTGDNLCTFESGVQHCHRHGTLGKGTIVPTTPESKIEYLGKGLIEGYTPILRVSNKRN